MLSHGLLLEPLTSALGVIAGGIAIGGFLAHAGPAMRREPEVELRQATARGGLAGLALAILVVVLSALFDRLTG